MSHWESEGQTDEWYTPKYVFDAMETYFDMDVAAPVEGPLNVPCREWISEDSLERPWRGFVWMNPPFGGRNGLVPWLHKFKEHGQGVALVPDRTSAPWWQDMAEWCDSVLFVSGKIKFIRPDGSHGRSPSVGTTLVARGYLGRVALAQAQSNGLGKVFIR